jgi:CHRD domain
MSRFIRIFFIACTFLFTGFAHAIPVTFTAVLTGASESPGNSSLGTGTAAIGFDLDAHTLTVHVDFRGLSGVTTASHIHCCTATPRVANSGVATETPFFDSFPIGVTAGFYDHVFDMTLASSFGAGFLAANGGNLALAEQALFNGSVQGRSYLNVHSSAFPAGEIRGFLQATSAIPLPSSLLLLGIGFGGLMSLKRNSAKTTTISLKA